MMIGSSTEPLHVFLLFTSMFVAGLVLEAGASQVHYFLTRNHYKENHFTFGKYLFLLAFPLVSVLIIGRVRGLAVLQIFLTFCILGGAMEWLVGWAYHAVVGQRLWTYHKYAIGRYTSWLSVPLWGIAGVWLWLLAQVW